MFLSTLEKWLTRPHLALHSQVFYAIANRRTAMPIYEYECSACGHRIEVIQKMSDSPLETCDNCSQPALRKMVSAAGFRLKGTGWYVTDFRDKGKPKQASNKSKADGEKETPTEKKKEETSASKSEAGTHSTRSGTGSG
jgi:putative FmdB family regulatory protein